MKIAVIVGTRPEIIKMSPVIRELKKRKLEFFVVHSTQHYSDNMDKVFFKDLELSDADYYLNIKHGSQTQQTASIMTEIEEVFLKEKPTIVLVQGDTNTVLAAALVAIKMNIKIGHVEAGLRSFDLSMPEEANRIMTDHISDFLFCPTSKSQQYLYNEGLNKEKIFVTGNTVVDAVYQNLDIAKKKSTIIKDLKINNKKIVLITLHRPSNVDDKKRLSSIITSLIQLANENKNLEFIWPIHPRTLKNLRNYKLFTKLAQPSNLRVCDPIGYLDFLKLMDYAQIIITDSGGIQEESCILNTKCITLRENTERPETVEIGANKLVKKEDNLLDVFNNFIEAHLEWENPYGDGNTAVQILDLIIR